MRQKTQLIVAVGLAIIGLLVVLISPSGLAIAADQCAAFGGGGGCHPTIQAAITAAGSGDTVRVVAGTYNENIIINKSLTLLGGFNNTTLTGRTPRSSVIDGGGNNSVIRIANGAAVTIDGFTITGGNATANNGAGGGIDVRQATAVIRNNLIEGNIASSDPAIFGLGGGIHVISSTSPVLISGNTIQANLAYSVVLASPSVAQGGVGGGIWVDTADSTVIIDNQVLSNVAAQTNIPGPTFGGGGGIGGFGDNTNITIDSNTVRDNIGNLVGDNGFGGGIALFSLEVVTVTNNNVSQNTALGSGANATGGGIHVDDVQMLKLTGNWVMSNTAGVTLTGSNLFAGGGGIRVQGNNTDNDLVVIENNHLIGNVAAQMMTDLNNGSVSFVDGGGLNLVEISNTHIISNEVSGNIAVENLSLSGSGGFGGRPSGGGMHLNDNDTVTLSNNEVRDNVTAQQQVVNEVSSGSEGGGIALNDIGNATVSDNTVADNTAVVNGSFTSNSGENYYPNGGGLIVNCFTKQNCNLSIVDNDISNNVTAQTVSIGGTNADGFPQGGGLTLRTSAILLQSNVISGNTANLGGSDGSGGAIDTNASTIVMSQNHILGNRTAQSGGGLPAVWLWESSLTSSNNVFARNTGGAGAAAGGFTNPSSSMTFINDTFYNNGQVGIQANMTSTVWVTNTIVAGHQDGLRLNDPASTLKGDYNLLNNTNNLVGGATGGSNDILNQNPLFVDAATDDFHLNSNSPAIDKGNASVAPALDFDGDTRGANPDIGADEYRLGQAPGTTQYLPLILKNS